MKRIGIFAGTFDPIHQGHIAFCLAAAEKCGLNTVYLLPEPTPRNKQNVTSITQRVQQINEAIEPFPELEVVLLDEEQFSVSRTLPNLHKKFPDAAITLLIGSDIACYSFAKWPRLDTLLQTTDIAIGIRSAHSEGEVTHAMDQLQHKSPALHYCLVTTPYSHLSSSVIRTEVRP